MRRSESDGKYIYVVKYVFKTCTHHHRTPSTLTVDFQENHLAHAGTNIILRLAEKMALRLFTDLHKVYGTVGRQRHVRLVEKVLVFAGSRTDGLLPCHHRLRVAVRLTVHGHILAGLRTGVFGLQHPFRWHVDGDGYSEAFGARIVGGDACVVAGMLRCNVLDDEHGAVFVEAPDYLVSVA